MIKLVGEHSVDLSLLTGKPILDVGCRDFEFTDSLWARDVRSIDIDEVEDRPYYRLAISDRNGYCGIHHSNDPQATRIGEGSDIPMMTIPTFSKMVGVKEWDLIKLDIEGEEIKVLKSLTHPYCKQISVEFHAHSGQTKQEIDYLLDLLGTWYTIHNAVWEERHGAGFNYWDVLLIAK